MKANSMSRILLAVVLSISLIVTGCSAQWISVALADLPVLTQMGDGFPGRVGASLLAAAGLPELVATSRDDYVTRAVALGNDRPRLAAMAAKLRATRDTLPLFDLDVRLFEQALLNVLDNALRYSPQGTPITIDTQQGDGVVRIRIADAGVGVAEADRELVFEKFRRGSNAPRSDGGVGLGLTICRAILRAHGGEITMSGAPNGGALVTLSLPTSKLAIGEATLRLPSVE